MALLTPQDVPITGVAAVFTAVNASETITPRPNSILAVVNSSGVSTTVTIVVPGTTFGQANPDVPVVVTAGQTKFIFLERFSVLADPTTRFIDVTYSATASVSAALLEHT